MPCEHGIMSGEMTNLHLLYMIENTVQSLDIFVLLCVDTFEKEVTWH